MAAPIVGTPLKSTITVPYKELHDGLDESVDLVGVYATKKYLVAWKDRWQFMKDVAGKTVMVGTPTSPILIRQAPLAYPDNQNLYANGVSVKPLGISHCTTPGSYDQAEITVTFSTPSFDYENQQGAQNTVYRTISYNCSAQIMSLPESSCVFSTGGQPPKQTPGFLIPTVEISITSHQVPYLACDQIFPLVGSINIALFYGCSTGTLMFMGARANRQATSEGFQAWELEYVFNFRPYDWNKFFNPQRGVGWDYLLFNSSGPPTYLYNYADFTTLP